MPLLAAWLLALAPPDTFRMGVFFAGSPAVQYPELSAPTWDTETRRGLKTRLRDGVVLLCDVVKPKGAGPFPAILERTPYGRANALPFAEYWARRGYAYVVQDCRGRGGSDGIWEPFVKEGRDGYDTVEWVARQSWCDGKVGSIVASYGGTDQWQTAVERPPSLRCIVPEFSLPDAMRGLPYEYGAFDLYGALWWTHTNAKKKADLLVAPKTLSYPRGLEKLPLADVDRAVFGRTDPIYQRWLRRTTIGDWLGFDHLDRLADSQVPALHVSCWLDREGIGTKLAWEAMRRAGRKDQWLVYGPWTHAFDTATQIEKEDDEPNAPYDLDGLILRFFDTYLKGRTVGMDEIPRAQAFITGANRWVSLDGWPSSTSALRTLYLAPGSLQNAPGLSGASVYTYDPMRDRKSLDPPSTTRVGLPPEGTYAFFQGPIVDRATAIAGPFEVRLFFKSSAKDTDLFTTLVDVAPSGEMRRIGQTGKLRAAYRDGLSSPSLLKPGRVATALLRPGDAAHEIAKGHRLGLLIESSLFPRYARNLGFGEPLATARRSMAQRNVIFSGTVTPSRVTFRTL